MPETIPQPAVVQRTFASTIESLRYGGAGDELDAALRQLVQQCKDTGRAGELGHCPRGKCVMPEGVPQ